MIELYFHHDKAELMISCCTPTLLRLDCSRDAKHRIESSLSRAPSETRPGCPSVAIYKPK